MAPKNAEATNNTAMLSSMSTGRPEYNAISRPRAPELRGNAPRRVTAPSVVAAESEADMGFHPEPWYVEKNRDDSRGK